jgi:transcriptional accessory protein Tex/SPT6
VRTVGPREKIKEMERRRDEIIKAISVKSKEAGSLNDKLEENMAEFERISDRYEQHGKKVQQQKTFDRRQSPQEKVDGRKRC